MVERERKRREEDEDDDESDDDDDERERTRREAETEAMRVALQLLLGEGGLMHAQVHKVHNTHHLNLYASSHTLMHAQVQYTTYIDPSIRITLKVFVVYSWITL
jgi:hypothetical protein